ncbi:hypothetical protein BJ138DRAFT_1158067 [Hygrophoropsis aurantiaca]|uniref:Uncharacterized protein n=1 Tax=Hygrophoropsis aurantiaca TaxID=72124 RepID=A0ACB8A4E2_9AGAM|nr:hypothetical protein BJ138DRAFT_1158067 [Hygrophoropsis aurantiaca]
MERPCLTTFHEDGSDGPVSDKHPRFWLEDGNTYRLHQSRLRHQSPLFKHFLDGKQPRVGKHETLIEVVKGSDFVVYNVFKTQARDFEALLNMDMEASISCFEDQTFETMAQVLRAATDLEFTGYRDFAVRYFEAQWPSQLSEVGEDIIPNALEAQLFSEGGTMYLVCLDVPFTRCYAEQDLDSQTSYHLKGRQEI